MQLRRLDKPWEDFNHELLVQAHLEARAVQAAEKERLEKEAKKAAKKGICIISRVASLTDGAYLLMCWGSL